MHYVQIKEGRIVMVAESAMPDCPMAVELPKEFDWEHIDRYEVTEDGRVIEHPLPEHPASQIDGIEKRLATLEKLLAQE